MSAVLIATIGTSFAATANSGPYIGAEGGANFLTDQNIDRNDQNLFEYEFETGYIGGMVFGYSFAGGLRPELELDYRRNRIEAFRSPQLNTDDVDGSETAYSVMTNLWFDIKRPTGLFSVMHPYIGGGIGAARVEFQEPTVSGVQGRNGFDTRFAYQGGAGVGFDLSPKLTLSLDYRHLQTDEGTFASNIGPVDAHYRAHSAMLGMRYSFGRPAPVMVSEPVRAAPAPPPPAPPRDSDGDGVIDSMDKCANTPRGFKVDTTGCIIEQTVILRGINFMFNSDQLTAPAQDTLNEVGAALVGQPTLNIQIVGHTDSVGSSNYNENLSHKRSDSVRRYLVSRGVTAANLQARGAGESNPIASNDTEEGRAENRRVEFVVLNKPANVKVQAGDSTSQSKSAAEAGEPKHLQKK